MYGRSACLSELRGGLLPFELSSHLPDPFMHGRCCSSAAAQQYFDVAFARPGSTAGSTAGSTVSATPSLQQFSATRKSLTAPMSASLQAAELCLAGPSTDAANAAEPAAVFDAAAAEAEAA
eukprot:jgi/Ulvmu1/12627/UM093_0020.1